MNSPVILIIDDEPQIRKLLSITLQSNDFSVVETQTAKEGMITAASHPPDLILLDLGLPDESGHDVLVHLREWYSNPIIILSLSAAQAAVSTVIVASILAPAPVSNPATLVARRRPRTHVGATDRLDPVYAPRMRVASAFADYFRPTTITDAAGELNPALADDLLATRYAHRTSVP